MEVVILRYSAVDVVDQDPADGDIGLWFDSLDGQVGFSVVTTVTCLVSCVASCHSLHAST